MKKLGPIIACLFLFLASACSSNQTHEETKSQTTSEGKLKIGNKKTKLKPNANLNLTFLIDLSDRIDPEKYPNKTMEYYERDTGYIASVVNAMINHLAYKKTIAFNDRIRTFIDPPPQDPEVNKVLKNLNFHFTKDNTELEVLNVMEQSYPQEACKLYQGAIKDNNYIGADIWSFFKNKAKRDCIKDGSKNILVILTDGYLYHSDNKRIENNRFNYIGKKSFKDKYRLDNGNWKARVKENGYGFIPATQNLSELEVLVCGLNPYEGNPYEEDVLSYFWESWLQDMGVNRYKILGSDLPISLDESIQEFILTEK